MAVHVQGRKGDRGDMRPLGLMLAAMAGCTTGGIDPLPDASFPEPDAVVCGVEWCRGPETCNGEDDDLDGTADEGVALESCGSGPCGPGVRACLAGRWTDCLEPEPVEESGSLRCNGRDDDCDSAVDEDPPVPQRDVLILLDRSGSMGPHIWAVANAWADVADRLGPEWRAGLVVFPEHNFGHGFEVRVPLPALPGDVAAELRAVAYMPPAGSEEASWDVLGWAAGDGPGWRPGADRFVFLVTDERGQSYAGSDEARACGAFPPGVTVVSFSDDPEDFDACGITRALGEVPYLGSDVRDPC